MELKELGKTGVKIPEIGFGTWQSRSVEAIKLAIELGSKFIDTAEMYNTEGLVAKALEGIREEVFIATKVSPNHFRYEDVLKAAEASLRRLRTSCIDLYQLHWPSSTIPIRETMRAMERLVEEGKVRYIGVSNFSVEETKEAQEALSRHEIVSNQVEYSLLNRGIEMDLLPYCEREGITVIAYSPLARGRIASKGVGRSKIALALDDVSRRIGKTVSQIALNWVITRKNVVAIPKADRLEHVKENCGASGWRLSDRDYRLLDEASR